MGITLGTDIDSGRTIRLLGEARGSIAKTFERMSSGLRINSASDDAAGLAVSSTLDAKRRVAQTAMRNLNDGISALAIMDGTLEQQTTLVTRLKELAEQSANGVFSITQRQALDREYQQLIKEYGRLAEATQFNGLSLLRAGRSGALSSIALQAGLNGSSSSGLAFQLSDAGAISGTLQLGNPDRSSVAQEGVPDGILDSTDFFYHLDYLGVEHSIDDLSSFYRGQMLSMEVTSSNGTRKELAVGIYTFSNLVYISTWEKRADGSYSNVATDASMTLNLNTGTLSGTLSAPTATFQDGSTKNIQIDVSALRVFSSESTASGKETNVLDFSGVLSATMARAALETATERLTTISQLRGNLGAYQARINTALSTLSIYSDVTAEASSRIKDADVATEAAALVGLRIKEQTAALVLRSSRGQRRIALDLLRV